MDPVVARKTWRTLEPVHAMIYFVPEGREAYAAAGLCGNRMGYFASRAAPMGPVPAEVVIATFFNFEPSLVRASIPEAWRLATPEKVLAARLDAVDRALRRVWGDDVIRSADVATAADLARTAALTASEHPEGRPLFAGHTALAWPDEPHLVLWHAQALLREFRGDGHVATLVAEGLSGIEALVIHEATGEIPDGVLRTSRAWTADDWAAAVERLTERGLVEAGDELRLTDAGQINRSSVEERTDALALSAYVPLGDDGCQRLREIGRPLSRAVVDAGLLTPDPSDW
ncbi:MAG: SCO6745 family protein [Acidimicrobiia bacterium]